MQECKIKPVNTYNIDEIEFLIGLGQSERVLKVVWNPRENGMLRSQAQR